MARRWCIIEKTSPILALCCFSLGVLLLFKGNVFHVEAYFWPLLNRNFVEAESFEGLDFPLFVVDVSVFQVDVVLRFKDAICNIKKMFYAVCTL